MRKLLILIIIIFIFSNIFSENIFANDSYFSRDKIDHFFTPFIITVSSYILMKNINDSENTDISVGIAIPALFSIGKEIYDGVSGTGEVSYKDLLYDFAGILTGILIVRL